MLNLIDSAHFIVALFAAGFAVIFMISDGASRTTRALSLWLLCLSLAVISGSEEPGMGTPSLARVVFGNLMEVLAVLFGLEWGRRVGKTAAHGRLQSATNVLFRISQGLVGVYALLLVGYVKLYPELALQRASGLIVVRGAEFAVFAPVLGSALLLAGIALMILLLMRIDAAEKIRLRAILISSPFLLAGLMVEDRLVPASLTLGLLVLFAGSVRYLQVMSRRGDFMRQFLSPEVARVVQQHGLSRVLKRERRPLSVVACDLRGFTAYARQRDSDAVATLLERFYEVVGTVAAQHGGTIKDHAGDGVLILVGAPLPVERHAARAAQLALDLRERVQALLAEAGSGLGVGIGVASGRITVGAIRGAGRLEYVAVGNAVNLAARLCARADDGEILVDDRVQAALQDQPRYALSTRQAEMLKGYDTPVAVYGLDADSAVAGRSSPA